MLKLCYSTNVDKLSCVLFYGITKVKVIRETFAILSKFLAVSNQNMYTLNLHIGILDDATSVEVVGALCDLCY